MGGSCGTNNELNYVDGVTSEQNYSIFIVRNHEPSQYVSQLESSISLGTKKQVIVEVNHGSGKPSHVNLTCM